MMEANEMRKLALGEKPGERGEGGKAGEETLNANQLPGEVQGWPSLADAPSTWLLGARVPGAGRDG